MAAKRPSTKKRQGKRRAEQRGRRRRLIVVAVLSVFLIVAVTVVGYAGLKIFKVSSIEVEGARKYTAGTITQNSGIELGDSLLFIRSKKTERLLTAALPYVKSARLSVTMPDIVTIVVTEETPVLKAETGDGYILLSSEMKVLENVISAAHYDIAVIDANFSGEQIPGQLAVFEDEREKKAFEEVVSALEKHDIMGKITLISVASPSNVLLKYGDEYEIRIGDYTDAEDKLALAIHVIRGLAAGEKGTIVVSSSRASFIPG